MSLVHRPCLPAAAVLMLWLAACSQPQSASPKTPTAVGVYQATPQPYTVIETLPGRTRAYMTSDVRPQVDGIIKKRLFTEGAEVKVGCTRSTRPESAGARSLPFVLANSSLG